MFGKFSSAISIKNALELFLPGVKYPLYLE